MRPEAGAQEGFNAVKNRDSTEYDSFVIPPPWNGRARRSGRIFEVPTLPLFIHERLSTQAILDTLHRHKRDRTQTLNLFGESDKSIGEKIRGAYEHLNGWQNRLILGDSLQVMNSLLQYENMGGKVQMVYMDPPYGIKFGGNFQPFVKNAMLKTVMTTASVGSRKWCKPIGTHGIRRSFVVDLYARPFVVNARDVDR